MTGKAKGAKPAMLLSSEEVRHQLKLIAALTESTMTEVLARVMDAELKRVTREVLGSPKVTR